MNKYLNRRQAGTILAGALTSYANHDDVIVLALPRGGVPVGYEVAKALHAPLDIFVVRKLGVPNHPELAMGAIAMGGACVFNDEIIQDLAISEEAMQSVIATEEEELKRRVKAYRGNKPYPSLRDKTVILVDDGIATGASMRAAVQALQKFDPKAIIVAIPVADKGVCHQVELLVDKLVCTFYPAHLSAVGAWYEDFAQTEDLEVHELLNDK